MRGVGTAPCHHMARQGTDAGGQNPMAKELHLWLHENQLVWVDHEIILPEPT